MKCINIVKEEKEFFLFRDDMIMCIENSRESIGEKMLGLRNKFSKSTGPKVNIKNQLFFYVLATNIWDLKYFKNYHL